MMHVTRRPTIVLLLLMIVLAGCGKSGPQVAPVHGRVMLDKQPLAGAEVLFQPDSSQRPSMGRTDAEGRYELMFKRGQSGAIIGPHSVHITVSPEVVPNPPKIAARFNTQTELHQEVKPGDNEFDFDVTTEKK